MRGRRIDLRYAAGVSARSPNHADSPVRGECAANSSTRTSTADGKTRASVPLRALQTLWFNTGTLCNLTCANCYIESSPRNDRFAYLDSGRCRGVSRRDRNS